jgi:hypothetical protein
LKENYEGVGAFVEQDKNGIRENDIGDPGDMYITTERLNPVYVIAECLKCEHMWRLRGINQIADLIEFINDDINSP